MRWVAGKLGTRVRKMGMKVAELVKTEAGRVIASSFTSQMPYHDKVAGSATRLFTLV